MACSQPMRRSPSHDRDSSSRDVGLCQCGRIVRRDTGEPYDVLLTRLEIEGIRDLSSARTAELQAEEEGIRCATIADAAKSWTHTAQHGLSTKVEHHRGRDGVHCDQHTPLELPARKPLVYISLGTIHTLHRDLLQKCFDAFADYDGCFVVSAGRTADTLNPPPNFVVKSHVPQLDILQREDLFITHAGMNGVQEGLYYGVPMVFVPQQMEQFINARIAEAKGVGIIIGDTPPYGEKFTVEELRDVVAKVLANPEYRSAAQRLSRSLRAAGGTERYPSRHRQRRPAGRPARRSPIRREASGSRVGLPDLHGPPTRASVG